jgi:hypothetical protein
MDHSKITKEYPEEKFYGNADKPDCQQPDLSKKLRFLTFYLGSGFG